MALRPGVRIGTAAGELAVAAGWLLTGEPAAAGWLLPHAARDSPTARARQAVVARGVVFRMIVSLRAGTGTSRRGAPRGGPRVQRGRGQRRSVARAHERPAPGMCQAPCRKSRGSCWSMPMTRSSDSS